YFRNHIIAYNNAMEKNYLKQNELVKAIVVESAHLLELYQWGKCPNNATDVLDICAKLNQQINELINDYTRVI
ncbi:MAG: hypothetical protein WCI62_05290, partial [Erysipelotrichaceae bacterium]